ncbi:MAG: DeoR/GlpR family DNA-binding transcription regulator [Aerococcaceae bacterium]|nr:DeoR/GlpR family DNA-binding transcription regulator [Aerococcaceae bacterium]
MMITELRHERIVQKLNESSVISIHELIELLQVSEATVRRDLSQLEQEGKLIRVHGGARKAYRLDEEPSFKDKQGLHHDEKLSVAQHAATLVDTNDVIYLDAGTTTFLMIPFLVEKKVLVVTNGLSHANRLMELGIDTILLGGKIKQWTGAIIGSTTIEQLKQYRIQKAFLGMNGVDVQHGYTTPDIEEAAVKKTAVQQSNQAFILADKTKIGKVTFCCVAPIENATLITNTLSEELRNSFATQTQIKEC